MVEKKIFPLMRNITEKAFENGVETKILWIGSEDMKVKASHKFTGVQVDTLRESNEFMRRLIEEDNERWYRERVNKDEISKGRDFDFFPKINYVDLMTKTVYSKSNKTGELLLGDGTHKLMRRISTNVPTSLWADTNGILNYFCNSKMGFEGVDCCV